MSTIDDKLNEVLNITAEVMPVEVVKEKKISHMDAVLWYCEDQAIEPDSVKSLISKALKEKIEANARDLNFLPRQAQLPI